MKSTLLFLGTMTLMTVGIGTAPPAFAAPELSAYISVRGNSNSAPAGQSITFEVDVANDGDVSAPAEVFIVFAGKLDPVDQIRAGDGFECELRPPGAGTNGAIRCTNQQLAPKSRYFIVVQGRGSAPGAGQVVATVNPGGTVPPEGGFGNPSGAFADNTFQKNVTIN